MADVKKSRLLPRLLAPVAKQIAEIHALSDAFQKVAAFQELYRVVLQHGLQNRPSTVLLVDDAMVADAASMAILIDLGREPLLHSTPNRSSSQPGSGVLFSKLFGDNATPSGSGANSLTESARKGGSARGTYSPITENARTRKGANKRCVVIMGIESTQFDETRHQATEGSSLADLMADPQISFLKLLPLSREAVGDLACQLLVKEEHRERKLDEDMVDMLAGSCHQHSALVLC